MYFLNDNVSLVLDCVYICWWMLFLCFIVYVLSVTHMLYGYRVFVLLCDSVRIKMCDTGDTLRVHP